jgi:hypothetical protein
MIYTLFYFEDADKERRLVRLWETDGKTIKMTVKTELKMG